MPIGSNFGGRGGIDLKLTQEAAVKQLGEEVEHALARIRAIGEDIAMQLSAIDTAVRPIDIAKAEIAAIIDFVQPYDNQQNYRPQMQLNLNGQGGGCVDLHNGVRRGRYRAVIVIERLGDLE